MNGTGWEERRREKKSESWVDKARTDIKATMQSMAEKRVALPLDFGAPGGNNNAPF